MVLEYVARSIPYHLRYGYTESINVDSSYCYNPNLSSYAGTGLQAVLELYFAPFLYVCSNVSRAKTLSTTSVNVYIAVYQLCALSAGFLADKVFGEYSCVGYIYGIIEVKYNIEQIGLLR